MKQFDLEQAIMASWSSVEDLKLFYNRFGEDLDDHGQNYIIGLIEMIDARHEETFKRFEELIKEYRK